METTKTWTSRRDKSWNFIIVSNHANMLRQGLEVDDNAGGECSCEACWKHRNGTPITLERINELRG